MDREEFDAEHRILVACAIAPGYMPVEALRPAIEAVQSWERLAASAALNQLRPQLAACVSGVPPQTGGAARARAELQEAARVHEGHALMMAAELRRALDILRAGGVLAVPFKGPAFASLLHGRLAHREMGDLDILLLPGDITRAVDALVREGHECMLPTAGLRSSWLPLATNELGLERAGSPVMIELHWRLAPRWCPVAIEVADVFANLAQRPFLGHPISWPGPEELLLVHVVDGMKSGGCGIRWLGDMATILRGEAIDWTRVSAIARRNGGVRSLGVALAVVEELSAALASDLRLQQLRVDLEPEARALAANARRHNRSLSAIRDIRNRLATDSRLTGPLDHFRWALKVADRPARASAAVLRHMAGPTMDDLMSMPASGLSDVALRIRALRRRLGER